MSKYKVRYVEKCIQYIESDRPHRLKSYIRKHKLDVKSMRHERQDTLLHIACRLGHEDIVRLLLKNGADCSIQNDLGLLPIHLAVEFVLAEHPKAVSDIVLPLVKAYPGSLDIPDAHGRTCRELLRQWKQSIVDNISSSSESSDTNSDDWISEPEDSRTRERTKEQKGSSPNLNRNHREATGDADDSFWSRRLAEEMEDEYMEGSGRHEQDHHASFRDSETWNDWASRMYSEHRTKSQGNFIFAPGKHHKRGSKRSTEEESSRPKISEEKRRKFEENQKRENDKRSKEVAEVKRMVHQQNLDVYDLLCDILYGSVPKVNQDGILKTASHIRGAALKQRFILLKDSSALLRYQDIPWPVTMDNRMKSKEEVNEDNITKFLFTCKSVGSPDYNSTLKKEQRRWHPDRFLQKCSARLKERDKDLIIETVTRISQVLNRLSENT